MPPVLSMVLHSLAMENSIVEELDVHDQAIDTQADDLDSEMSRHLDLNVTETYKLTRLPEIQMGTLRIGI